MPVSVRLPERLHPALKVAPARPAIAAGLRAATATVAPLALGMLLGAPEMLWASLGGFSVSLADRGGAYSTRALSMGSLVGWGALGAIVGGLAGGVPGAAVPTMFACAVVTSLVRVYGTTAAVVGTSVATAFLLSVALPAPGIVAALERGGFLAAGGAWAMLLSLVLWPLRPFRPARLDLERCYRTLATYASHVAERAELSAREQLFGAGVLADRAAMREALEAARATLVAMRRGRQESGRADRLVELLEIADRSFATLLSVGELLDSVPPFAVATPAREAAERALEGFASTALYVARIIADELAAPPPMVGWSGDEVRSGLTSLGEQPSDGVVLARAAYTQLASLLDQLRGYATAAGEVAAALEEPARGSGSAAPAPSIAETSEHPAMPPLAPLRDALAVDSVPLRHALRVGIVTAIAVWLTTALHVERGYWVTLTVLVVLQPQAGATFIRVVQRVAGTVAGGVIAAAIAAGVHDTRGIMVIVFLLAATSVAVLPLNYAVFAAFLTPTFVLLAEVQAGDWHLAGERILSTIAGGVLALVGARLLWPQAGRAPVEQELATALSALRTYVARIASYERGAGAGGGVEMLASSRRKVGLAIANAETTFQWRLGEVGQATSLIEPIMAALAYTRRFSAAMTAMTWPARPSVDEGSSQAIAAFASASEAVLADLAAAVIAPRVPAPLPPALEAGGVVAADAPPSVEPLVRAQLERAGRQLATLHSAISRLAEPVAPGAGERAA